MPQTVSVAVTLEVRTCKCGGVYAVPPALANAACPICVHSRHAALVNDIVYRDDEIAALEGTIRSLRGTITRMKKAK